MFTAVVAVVILVAAALAVDLGNTWARRGQLQAQADRAAMFGAQYLPADTAAQKTKVAKSVAYYFACNPVAGQRQLNPTMPACPATPDSASLDSYAATLLSTTMVDLSIRNRVKVTTPPARVDFGFGGAADADGTTQQKYATAKITSPGMLAPMALNLDCLLNPASTLLPGPSTFGYISTTHQSSGPAEVTTWDVVTQAEPKMSGISPGRVPEGVPARVQISGRDWPELEAGERFVAVFGKGALTPRPEATGVLKLNSGKNPNRLGYLTVDVPSQVTLLSGEWQVKVAVEGASGPTGRVYSADVSYLVVDDSVPGGAVACGRLLKSPRGGTQATINFILNLQEGLDHAIAQDPGVLSTGSLTLDNFDAAGSLTGCGGTSTTDTNGLPEGAVPTCVVTNMSNSYEAGFTEGMIGAAGRLTCRTARPCASSFSLNGQQINDDEFTDFVIGTSPLTSSVFFNADTYLTPGVPVVTPDSRLHRDIFGSHRFMWVAVISTVGANSAVQAGDYPVLTFRPIFIAQKSILDGSLPLLPSFSGVLSTTLAQIDSVLMNDLGPVTEPDTSILATASNKHGLLMDSSNRLRAVRFMTISPQALPAVPDDYSGPESDYLGVGPKLVRLVE